MSKGVYNPWAGLASYQDPEVAEHKLKFCGRDDDTYDVVRLIMGNVFVTLYGKSGIGKTSLLNAGVFPELREGGFTPVSIRLGIRDDHNPKTFQEVIIEAVERAVKRYETIDVISEQSNQNASDYLWSYFVRHRFYDKNDEPTIPVLVLDQFEEVFREDREEIEGLLRQLDYLNDRDHIVDACDINGVPYRYERNFRFIVSIREDDLYRLEDILDNCYLPALKRNRYRLRSLSDEGAHDAIATPGDGLFSLKDQDRIIKAIIHIARLKSDGSISTNLLSLVCNRIYNDYLKSGSDFITYAFVESFIQGNPIERFYNEATKSLSGKEKAYIEAHLVDSAGRRNSIPESDFLNHIPGGKRLLEGDTRILQRTSASSDGSNYRIELIHDSFCGPLQEQKEKREKRRRSKQILFMLCVIVISLVTIAFIATTNWKMLENKARFVAEKGMELIDKHDHYTARLLALEVLPRNLKFPNKPYVPEAERLLRESVTKENAILMGHTRDVNSAVFSPDGNLIVSASMDSTVRIWDASTGAQLQVLEGHTGWVNSASFSPDGNLIVSASGDSTIRIWDASTGVQLQVLEGHTGWVNSASFSPDGKRIVSASNDSTICIWDASTGVQHQVLAGHTRSVVSASFSLDGKRIVSVSRDNTVRIWDTSTGAQLQVLTVFVESASFSPDGSLIVSASMDGTVRIWDTLTGVQLQVLEGDTGGVLSASFSPDGTFIVSASMDGTIRIWDASTGVQLQVLEGHTGWVNSASFSPDGKRIVSASWDSTVRIWDASTGVQLRVLEGHTGWVNSASFSPDGKRIVSASADNTVRIWDASTGVQLQVLEGHTGGVNSASFSLDGKHIVSASADNTVRIWDASTGVQFQVLEGHTGEVNSASFSLDGKRIVSASRDGIFRIWDTSTGVHLQVFAGNIIYGVESASFSPDGSLIVSASRDNTVRIWDVSTGVQLQALEVHTGSALFALFSLDGNFIVSAFGNIVRIWDASTGAQLQVLEGHTGWVNSASFSPDGKRIISASRDSTIRIWEYPPLQELIDQTRERFKNRQLTPDERKRFYL